MKKLLRNAMMLSAMAGTLFFTSCGEDEVLVTVDAPSLTLTSQLEDSYAEGEEVLLTYGFNAPGKIGQVKFEFFIGGSSQSDTTLTETELGLTAQDTTGTFDLSFNVPTGTAGSIFAVEATIIDRSNQQFVNDDAEFLISAAVNSYTTVLIGGFNNLTIGSFYDALADSVYSSSSVRNSVVNQGSIDFMYYFTDASQRVIASPDNAATKTTWNAQDSNPYPFTSTENSTVFKPATSAVGFGFINSNEQIRAAFGEVGDETSRVTNLAVGQFYAFRIDSDRGGRYGVFQVTAVAGNSTGSITLDVKSQSVDN